MNDERAVKSWIFMLPIYVCHVCSSHLNYHTPVVHSE
jgi:hypothetical protein